MDRHTARVLDALKAVDTIRPVTDCAFPLSSWRRCMDEFQLDPGSALDHLPIVGDRELKLAREAMEAGYSIAADELDDLYASLKGLGYAAGLANEDGLFVLERADGSRADYVDLDRPGAVWTEQVGGTNALGTCLADRRPTSLFREQHYFLRLIDTACVAAPVLGPTGEIWGALSASTRNRHLHRDTHRLAADVVRQASERLAARLFRHAFAGTTILQWQDEDGCHLQLAVNPDQRIEGANALARDVLGLGTAALLSKPLGSIFERTADLLGQKACGTLLELRRHETGRTVSVTVRRPAAPTLVAKRRPVAIGRCRQQAAGGSDRTLDDCGGADPAMRDNVRILKRVLHADIPILLLGETGTGKDTLAKAMHAEGPRSTGPFVAFNCAAVPETLIDSELFGYSPGAFTGAAREGNRGRILEAHSGTLFLDEIGDMPLTLQTRLLRVLETREVVALGSGIARKVDIHIIAATNQDLLGRVRERTFREDLYYRLAGAVIHVPALRDRQDLDGLIDGILRRHADTGKMLDAAARQALFAHAWPGNIRELIHVLRRAISISEGEIISPADLMLPPAPSRPPADDGGRRGVEKSAASIYDAVAAAEHDTILAVLDEAGGDIDRSAQALGVSRATLYRKIRSHKLRRHSR